MSTSVTFNNTSYSIPAANEQGWASLSDFLIAVANYAAVTSFSKLAIRKATTTPITVSATTDVVVVSQLAVPAAVAVTLPAGINQQVFTIIDGTGDAQTNNITITPNGTDTIGGAATFVITANRGAVTLVFNSGDSDWKIANQTRIINPSSSTDNAIARYDGTKGILQNSSPTIDDSGNVVLPADLTVDTNTFVVDSSNNTVAIATTPSSTTRFTIKNKTAGQPAIDVDNAGGTATMFRVVGDVSGNGSILIRDTSNVTKVTFDSAGASSVNGGNFAVDTNVLFVDASANRVGINNGSPSVPLDVTGAAAISGDLTVDTTTLVVDSTNNRVGIATASPSVPLDVTGAAKISGDLNVDTNTLVVDATNNRVGIVTTSPTVPLDVTGAALISSTLGVTGLGTFTAGVKVKDTGAGSTTLSFYEENTFTPTVTTDGSAPSITYTGGGQQTGRFSRIGRLVYYFIRVVWTAGSGGTGNLQIGGLPYTVGAAYVGTLSMSNIDYTASTGSWIIAKGNSGTTTLDILVQRDNATQIAIDVSAATSGSFNKQFDITGFYEV